MATQGVVVGCLVVGESSSTQASAALPLIASTPFSALLLLMEGSLWQSADIRTVNRRFNRRRVQTG